MVFHVCLPLWNSTNNPDFPEIRKYSKIYDQWIFQTCACNAVSLWINNEKQLRHGR